jgi:hypothetical protein
MKLERYRKTMTHEVLQSWAEDAQNNIDEMRGALQWFLTPDHPIGSDPELIRKFEEKAKGLLNR